MANVLKMATVADIVTLIKSGHSDRRISAVLSLDRGTVAKYRRQLQAGESPTVPGESAHPENPSCVPTENPPNAPTGVGQEGSGLPVRTIKPGPPSNCEPYRGEISRKLEQGLTAQRIWQDLIEEHGFSGRYPTVRRFVHQLKAQTPELVRRMEVLPGAEAQVDFGTGAWIVDSDGKVSVRGTHGLSSRPKPGTVAVLRPAQGWVLALSVRDGLALAVSMALPLLGIAPVARQEPREVVRTASTRGSASSASGRTGVGAGINSIGNRRDLQMAEKDASCVLIRNINATIMAIGVDASGDTKSSAVAHVSRCGL